MGWLDDVSGFFGVSWDPWRRTRLPVPYPMFGRGSRRPFRWYLEGPTRVEVAGLDDIERWLRGCSWVDDAQLGAGDDLWMHPGRFEVVRMGDCDDHALWAWRKLVDLGRPASLVVGRWSEEPDDGHVWVVTERDGRPVLFETTTKSGPALHDLEEVRDQYRPFFAVDERLRTWAYAGAAEDLVP